MSFFKWLHKNVVGGSQYENQEAALVKKPATPATAQEPAPLIMASNRDHVERIAGIDIPVAYIINHCLTNVEVRSHIDALRIEISPILGIGEDKKKAYDLVDSPIIRHAAYAMDLPGAKERHHAREYGLMIHSLEAAREALKKAIDHRLVYVDEPESQFRLIPKWQYLAFLLGLTHDLAKTIDFDVLGPNGEKWDPFVEPLAAFYGRIGRSTTRSFRGGRTQFKQEALGRLFIPHIFTPAMWDFLHPIVVEAFEGESLAAKQLMSDVRQADSASVHSDIKAARAGEITGDVASIIYRMISDGLVSANQLSYPFVLIGQSHLLLGYPQTLDVLAQALSKCYPDLAKERDRAAALGRKLQTAGLLWLHPELKKSKLRALISSESNGAGGPKNKPSPEGVECILLNLPAAEHEQFRGLGLFAPPIKFTLVDGTTVGIQDFGGFRPAPETVTRETAKGERSAVHEPTPSVVPTSKPGPGPAPNSAQKKPIDVVHGSSNSTMSKASVPARPGEKLPPQQIKEFPNGNKLLADLKQEILANRISCNVGGTAKIFITHDLTYLLVPVGFATLTSRGYPNPCPRTMLFPYIDALTKINVVWKHERTGTSVFKIKTPPGSPGTLSVIAFDTEKIFTRDEILKLGYWSRPVIHVEDPHHPAPPGGYVEPDLEGINTGPSHDEEQSKGEPEKDPGGIHTTKRRTRKNGPQKSGQAPSDDSDQQLGEEDLNVGDR